MTSYSVLRVGSSDEGLANDLIQAVMGFLQNNSDSAAKDVAAGTSTDDDTVMKISNRYFDASVALLPLSVFGTTSINSLHPEDGILLVFKHGSKSDFDSMATLHAMAETNQENGDLLRMCIGISTTTTTTTEQQDVAITEVSSSKEQEEEYSRRVLWCLDHGYEYVEKVDLSELGVLQGHDEREKEGFARIMEAIQGTIWSNAKMHPKQKSKLQQSYQSTLVEHNIVTTSEPQDTESTYEPPPTTIPVTPSTPEMTDEEREEQARKALLQQDANPDTPPLAAVNGTNGKSSNQQQQLEEADQIMDSMEAALKDANRIRDLSRNGQLSDEERRKRAGDAAVLLMNLMNQMGGLPGEDDDEDDDDDEHENAVSNLE